MRIRFVLLALACPAVLGQVSLAQDAVDRQVIVQFRTDVLQLRTPTSEVAPTAAVVPPGLRGVLTNSQVKSLRRGLPDFRSADTLRVLSEGRVLRVPNYTNLFVITLDTPADETMRDSLVARLERLPFVEYAEKNQRVEFRGEVIPTNEPNFSSQWGLRNTTGQDIEATLAWEITKGSSSTILGVVDGTVSSSHPDLAGKVSGTTASSNANAHSTGVAGIMAAKGENVGGSVVGVDWYAQIRSDPLVYSGTGLDLVATAQSITNNAAAGARAINNSWGSSSSSITLTNALSSAYSADVLLVHANPYKSGTPGQTSNYPNSAGPWILNVGAMDRYSNKWPNTGAKSFTDVGAPGVDIVTTAPNGGVQTGSGTSFAAPFVVGTAGLLIAASPSLRAYDMEHLLRRTAQGGGTFDQEIGYGMINAYEALRRVVAPNTVTHGTASFTKDYSNVQRTFSNGVGGIAAGTYFCDVYRMSASRSHGYQTTPLAWLAPTAPGLSGANPNSGQPYLSESVSTTSMSLSTFFYFVRTTSTGQTVNAWVPYDPTPYRRNGVYEYTVIGTPNPPLTAYISGPYSLAFKAYGTYTAGYSGGTGTATYAWDTRSPGASTWTSTGVTTQTYTYRMNLSDIELRVRVQRGGATAYATQLVQYCAQSPCLDGAQAATAALAVADRPTEFALHPPSPNPARGAVEVRYDLPEDVDVYLAVYDVMGREVAVIESGSEGAGYHRARFEPGSLPAGVYLVRIDAGGSIATQRITIVR